jgi:hypothetical protein
MISLANLRLDEKRAHRVARSGDYQSSAPPRLRRGELDKRSGEYSISIEAVPPKLNYWTLITPNTPFRLFLGPAV